MSRGTIDQLPSGRWRLRLRIGGQRATSTYATQAEAERARDAQLMVLEETKADYEGLRVAELGKKVLTRREVKRQVRDPQSDWSRWREHVERDLLGRLAVRALRSSHVFQWLDRLEDKGLAPQTRRNLLSLLRTVLRVAHRDGRINTNPCVGIRVEGKDRDAWTYLTREELPRVLEACHAGVTRHLVAVAMGTGVRPGELVTLRRSDVFLDDRPRIVVRYGSAPDVPTKTGAVRTVPLFGLALVALESWMGRPVGPNPNDLVFPGLRGGFRSEDHVIRWEEWKGVLERAGLGRRFRWYDLRHTCASWLVSGWWGRRWNLQEVKEMLGHTSITITQRYAHLAASASEEAARATPADGMTLESGRVTPGHGLIGSVYPQLPPDTVKTSVPSVAPPGRLERPTSGLGIHGIGRSGAGIATDDPPVTCSPEGDPEEPPRWVLEATIHLYELLCRKAGSCAA